MTQTTQMTPRELGRLDGWYARPSKTLKTPEAREQYANGYAAGERHQELVRQTARRNGGAA